MFTKFINFLYKGSFFIVMLKIYILICLITTMLLFFLFNNDDINYIKPLCKSFLLFNIFESFVFTFIIKTFKHE